MKTIHSLYMAHPFGSRLRLREEEKRIEAATGLNLVNPFYDVKGRLDVIKFDKLSKGKQFKDRDERQKWISTWGLKPSVPKEVVERDLKAIRNTDGLLAFFTDKISIGTPMETFYASHDLHHPTYLIIEDRSKMGHPWLVYYATAIYTNVDEFIVSINMARQ